MYARGHARPRLVEQPLPFVQLEKTRGYGPRNLGSNPGREANILFAQQTRGQVNVSRLSTERVTREDFLVGSGPLRWSGKQFRRGISSAPR